MSYSRRRVADKKYEKLSNTALSLATVQREAFPKGRGGYSTAELSRLRESGRREGPGSVNPWGSFSIIT